LQIDSYKFSGLASGFLFTNHFVWAIRFDCPR